MDLPPVPAAVTALVAAGELPPDPADWERVADERGAGDDAGGAIALAGAYGCLEALEFAGSEEMTGYNDRATALLREAEERGATGTGDLWAYSERMRDVAVLARAAEEYKAEHGASPRQLLNAKLERAHALYEAGDRAAALALFREVAEVDLWGEFTGTADRADVGWYRLLHDAAHVEGPEATRRIWHEARASRRAARFPYPGLSCRLVEVLLGTGVPDILLVLVEERLAAAEEDQPAGRLPWPLGDDDRRVLALALDEVEQHQPTA
ncbi:hypothetical protein [Saccharothrix syringae]|uniref:Uncharacterized protein n=1 Tax=Saccharothrix syringae TaxID=103733 RepID=A0A5Q0H1W1_SACSY|nr:hypothetical protein [Saccharothrix syringae]QFZ20188.1 hypothetical protein EKG83_24720 [Saccharothrix syringae]